MEQEKIKDKVIYFISIITMGTILISMAYFFFLRTVEIDITENIEVSYIGENGMATIDVSARKDDLNQRMQEFLDTVDFEVSPNHDLSNGEVVTITATYDENLAQRYHYQITNTTTELTVEGLLDRYASLSQIAPSYLEDVLEAGRSYVQDHSQEILALNGSTDEDENWKLDNLQVTYAAFLKSYSSEATDRIIQICRLDFTWKDQTRTLYYLVCVPEINDGNEVQTQDIFGERAYMSEQEIQNQSFSEYVQRVFGKQYQIEQILQTQPAEDTETSQEETENE